MFNVITTQAIKWGVSMDQVDVLPICRNDCVFKYDYYNNNSVEETGHAMFS